MPLTIEPTNTNAQSVFGGSFSITGAVGTYQDTGFSITLPDPGTYLVYGNIRAAIVLASGINGWIATKLFNSTAAADVANSTRLIVLAQTIGEENQISMGFSHVMTVTVTSVLKLYAKRASTGSPTYTTSAIYSDAEGQSNLGYIKLSP